MGFDTLPKPLQIIANALDSRGVSYIITTEYTREPAIFLPVKMVYITYMPFMLPDKALNIPSEYVAETLAELITGGMYAAE